MKLEKHKLVLVIVAVVAILSALLPWATVNIFGFKQSISGLQGDGWFMIIAAGIQLFFLLTGDQEKPLIDAPRVFVLIAAAVMFLVPAYGVFTYKSRLTGLGTQLNLDLSALTDMVQIGIGMYLALFAGLVSVLVLVFQKQLTEVLNGQKSAMAAAVEAGASVASAAKDAAETVVEKSAELTHKATEEVKGVTEKGASSTEEIVEEGVEFAQETGEKVVEEVAEGLDKAKDIAEDVTE